MPTKPMAGNSRIEALDALRGLAAVWVVLYHMVLVPSPNLAVPQWASLASYGGMGVTLFFVVSAFSLCYSNDVHKDGSNFAFFTRRFFRIAPLFYSMLVFYYLWHAYYHTFHSPSEVIENLTFIFNLVPGRQVGYVPASWTIGVEMLFYILFPVLIRYAAGDPWKGISLLLASMVVADVWTRGLFWFVGRPSEYEQWTFVRHLPIFILGIVVYQLIRKLPDDHRRHSIGLVLLGTAAILLTAVVSGKTAVLDPYDWQGLVFAALLGGLLANPVSVLVNRVTVFLGKISYSLYLIHPVLVVLVTPVYKRIYRLPWPLSLKFSACFLITLLALVPISYCSFRLIEAPGISLGKRLLQFRNRRLPMEAVAAGM